MRMRAVAMLAAILLLAPAAAAQGERILSFHSDVTVHKDGVLTVTETIKVRAGGVKIKRGIYRDFPMTRPGGWWTGVRVTFELVKVLRDGKPEVYHVKNQNGNKRVNIGRVARVLPPGVYTYTLVYRTDRQLRFFKDHDELYWNVTGNDWEFTIEQASATVTLPGGVARDRIRWEAYTGRAGAKGKSYTAAVGESGRAAFRATRPLARGEGLTIVVSFPKGVVVARSAGERFKAFLAGSAAVALGLGGLVVVLVYYLVAWINVGRDPQEGVIIPLFEPAAGLSPAATRCVREMGFDNKCLTAAVVDLAVKGHLTIEQDDGDYTLVRNDGADDAGLCGGEQRVARKLLGSSGTIELDNSNHRRFQSAIEALKKALAKQCHGTYFLSNLKWFIPGVALSVLTLVGIGLVSYLAGANPVVGFLSIWLSFWSIGVFLLLRQVIASWRAVRSGKGGRWGKTGSAVFLTIFAVPFCIAEAVVLGILVGMTSLWLLPILLVIGLVNVRFHHLLKRPTVEGRKVMDQIEGFRMYLGTAEKDRLEYATALASAPQRTPQLFERYLPYALALDVENAWAEQFSDVLARASMAGAAYSPVWYRGSSFSSLGAGGFASAVGGSLSSALSSASTSPSGSGAGGGGSSGGGGGGGGGGGW